MAKLDTSNITFSDYEDNFMTTDESVIEALSSQIDFSSGIKRALETTFSTPRPEQ